MDRSIFGRKGRRERPRHVALVTSLGAKEVVDYTPEDVARGDASYDVVVDRVGNRKLRDLRRVVAPGGTLVLSGGGNPGDGSAQALPKRWEAA